MIYRAKLVLVFTATILLFSSDAMAGVEIINIVKPKPDRNSLVERDCQRYKLAAKTSVVVAEIYPLLTECEALEIRKNHIAAKQKRSSINRPVRRSLGTLQKYVPAIDQAQQLPTLKKAEEAFAVALQAKLEKLAEDVAKKAGAKAKAQFRSTNFPEGLPQIEEK